MGESTSITPQEMKQKTAEIFEKIMAQSSFKLSRTDDSNQEACRSDTDNDEPLNINRKRRKVVKKKLVSSSSDDDFEESPLRKSLSPPNPSSKRKTKACKRGKNNTLSGPKARYMTRNKKTRKKISYEGQTPEKRNSNSDSGSNHSILEDALCSSDGDWTAGEESEEPKSKNMLSQELPRSSRISSCSDDFALTVSKGKGPIPRLNRETSEDSDDPSFRNPSRLRKKASRMFDSGDEQEDSGQDGEGDSNQDSNQDGKEDGESSQEPVLENVLESESPAGSPSQRMEVENEGAEESSQEMMIVYRPKAVTPKKAAPVFGRQEKRVRKGYGRYDGSYYRDKADECVANPGEMDDFIVQEQQSSSSESSEDEKSPPKRARKLQLVSSDDDSSTRTPPENSGEESVREGKETEITPRRSSRQKPDKQRGGLKDSLEKLRKSRETGKMRHSSGDGESYSDLDEGARKNNVYRDAEAENYFNHGDFAKFARDYVPRQGGSVRSRRPRSPEAEGVVSSSEWSDDDDVVSEKSDDLPVIRMDVVFPEETRCNGTAVEDVHPDDTDGSELVTILRQGKISALPSNISPDTHPNLLCQASRISTLEIVRDLVVCFGYDVWKSDKIGRPLTHAILYNRSDIVPFLLREMQNKGLKIVNEICRRCAKKLSQNVECLTAVIDWQEKDEDLQCIDVIDNILRDGRGSRKMFEGIGESLSSSSLEQIYNVNQSLSEYSNTELLLFKCLENKERWEKEETYCLQFLECVISILGKCVIDVCDKEGYTPLMIAVANGLIPAVKALLNHGADPLALASSSPSSTTPSYLSQRYPDAPIHTTALHLAAALGQDECAKIIVKKNRQTLSVTDEAGWTPVMYAVYQGHWDTVKLLLGRALAGSSSLISAIHMLRNRRYKGSESELRDKNFEMIIELVRHVAENDEYREQLDKLVESCATGAFGRHLDDQIINELFEIPGLISLATKLKYIRRHHSLTYSRHSRITVRRDVLLEDLVTQRRMMAGCGHLSVGFIGEQAVGPGPTKEFYSLICDKAMEAKLFEQTKEGNVKFTNLMLLYKDDVEKFEFFRNIYEVIGGLIARSVLANMPIGLPLLEYISNFILGGHKNVLKDLENADKDLFNSLSSLSPEEFADLEIQFYVDIADPFTGETREVPLKSSMEEEVIALDKKGYMTLRSRKCLYEFVESELCAIERGFSSLFPAKLKKIITPNELSVIVGGEQSINLQDWMSHTAYTNISQETKTNFWSIVQCLKQEDRMLLLHFATGISRLPPGGFAQIPRFNLCRAHGSETDVLPRASTCSNSLILPSYTSRDAMRKYILIAIRYGSRGFVFV